MPNTGAAQQSLAAAFASPDASHSPAAYWFWHRLPTAEQIRAQIGQMLEGGYRSFQIQARLAYPIDGYLDDDYLSACRTAVAEASRRGMTVGIYDEYNWQSGQAGGRTVRGSDHLRERHLFWANAGPDGRGAARCVVDRISSSAAQLGPAGLAWQYDDARVAWTDWQLIAALAHPAGGIAGVTQIRDVEAAARITASSETGCVVEIEPDAELAGLDVTAFVAARSVTSRVPNYLMPETAERFLEVGYEPFRRALGEHFGTTVRYFFFDQPHATFHDWPQRWGNLRSSLPFAPLLAAAFEARTGRDFKRALLALLTDVGPETASLRCDFYQIFTEVACTNYLAVLAEWCRGHGVALSGHEVLGHVGSWHPSRAFSSWDLRVNFGLDYFGLDAYRQITGVDAQDCVPQLSTKMGDSVARSNGRSGCIVEQYMGRSPGAGGSYAGHWGLTLEELRAQAIRLTLAGARQFLFHAFYQTDGHDGDPSMFTNPRFDFPPGINFEPWWPFHRTFADEVARLSVFLDGGAPACDVAVLYPLRTCWVEGPGHGYGDHLEFWTSFLAETGCGFHLIDERDLLKARESDGRLRLGDRAYPCLVLPSVTALRSLGSLSVLRDFAASGGLLLSSGPTPAHLQAGDDRDLQPAWAAIAQHRRPGHHFDAIPDRAAVWRLLAPLVRRHPHARAAAGAGGQIWQWAGRDEESWRLAIFNDAADSSTVAITAAAQTGGLQEWDAARGNATPWLPPADPGASVLSVTLQPMELRLLRLKHARDGMPGGGTAHPPRASAAPRTAPGARSVRLSAGWTLQIPHRAQRPVPIDVERGWEEQGFADYSGTGVYSCRFDQPPGHAWYLQLPEVRTAVEVSVNGQRVGRRAWAPYEFRLPAELLRPTGNDLEITVFSAAGNKYYGGTPYQVDPEPSGLLKAPVIVAT